MRVVMVMAASPKFHDLQIFLLRQFLGQKLLHRNSLTVTFMMMVMVVVMIMGSMEGAASGIVPESEIRTSDEEEEENRKEGRKTRHFSGIFREFWASPQLSRGERKKDGALESGKRRRWYYRK
ncbi:hypothetical protein ACLOJK_025564 [Asimina triloba]